VRGRPCSLAIAGIPRVDPVVRARQVVLPVREPSPDEKRLQVQRISASPALRNAPLLQRFLEFITSRAGDSQPEELSEYSIATQVFGRPATFDPALDTIVRTQAYRLRTKLREYYESEGKDDALIIEIPKGHYIPTFAYREDRGVGAVQAAAPNEVPASAGTVSASAARRPLRVYAVTSALLGIAVVFATGAYVGQRWLAPVRSPAVTTLPEPVHRFWSGFLNGPDIIVAYTNSVFFETETGDLLRFKGGAVADRGAPAGRETALATAVNPSLAQHAGTLYYEDGYTGTGEVMAVHRLTSVLGALGANAIFKRSRLVTVNDFRNHDVIFLGSPFENQVLGEMHLPQRFVFQQPEEPPYLWRGRILDRKPGARAPRSYQLERDPEQQIIRADYGLFNVLPGPAPGRRIVVLAGLTTSGTQGAAEFATSEAGLQRIVDALGSRPGGRSTFPSYFECLVRVDAAKGLDAITVKYVTASKVDAPE
jgi:hypothetical protein